MPSCHDNHLRLLVASQCYSLPLQFFRRFIWVPVWNGAIRARGEAPRQWPGCRPGSHSRGTLCGRLCRGNVTNHWFLAFSFFSPANYILPCKESLAPKVTLKHVCRCINIIPEFRLHLSDTELAGVQSYSNSANISQVHCVIQVGKQSSNQSLNSQNPQRIMREMARLSYKIIFISKCLYDKIM